MFVSWVNVYFLNSDIEIRLLQIKGDRTISKSVVVVVRSRFLSSIMIKSQPFA
ncbi:hypothetical protein [[Phormidium ambiguum] IAM M-71]|uniref:hypothetical protein n=1 Tax=[Phormidium ambiguum] IAM M-71 TaxID=454136 RepID=UPI0015C19B95|nr:hypothetical protein [Phormidium ambiguum]